MLTRAEIEKFSGYKSKLGSIETLKKGNFYLLEIPIAGDAPKDFIAMYNYEEGVKKKSKKTWPRYIAKVGHKWYPNESISEHLLTRIGQVLNVNIANSKLIIASDQLRFLSRYFLLKDERLVHGAEIFAGYLGGDIQFAEEVERQNLARKLFTFQFAERAIREIFPISSDAILKEFVKMLSFDAITGNNDRHFYNWGVIVDIHGLRAPKFAPVFDSARGVFWNFSESKIVELINSRDSFEIRLKKYAYNSMPKTGWDEQESVNHFELIKKLYEYNSDYAQIIDSMLDIEAPKIVYSIMKVEFNNLLSPDRQELIKQLLEYRVKILKQEIR